jgi:hypothetical protein
MHSSSVAVSQCVRDRRAIRGSPTSADSADRRQNIRVLRTIVLNRIFSIDRTLSA